MVKELTQTQIDKMAEYRDEWTKKGLTTERCTLEDAIIDFSLFQTLILKKEKAAPVILLDSPADCWEAIIQFYASDGNKVVPSKERIEEVRKEIGNFIWPYFDCQFWAGWFSYYEFMKHELGVQYPNDAEYTAFKNCQKYGMVFPLDELCIVCQPPTVINRNALGLHCETGVALTYNGKNEIYALNGVVMKKEYVMTPASQLTPETILKETNVECRRELIKKVGMERMMESLPHTLLDKRGNYELFSINLSEEVKDARYLKMTNPSVGCYHLEGVAPEIATITDALKWRNQNLFVDAEVLT